MIKIILLLSLLTLSLADEQTCSSSLIPGPFTYSTGTTTNTGYLMQLGGSNGVTPSGGSVTVGGLSNSPRFYLTNTCASSWGPNVFQKFNLLGATISFTVDLSHVNCDQNAAFYFVGMPSSGSSSGGPSGGSSNPDYYCDANQVGGFYCYEMDVMEANRHALQVTPHTCSSLTGPCDHNGCAINTQSISNGYGPSSSYTINTQNPFSVKMTFSTTNSQLSGIVTVISQSSKSITLTQSCSSGYLQAMTAGMSVGMVPVWSFWTGGSGSMSWLDNPACSSGTNDVTETNYFIFSNLVISNAGTITPPPPPPPVPPASHYCGNQNCNSNANYIEFTSPLGSSSSPAPYVKCSGGVQCGSPCAWYAAGNKWQCPCGSSVCTNPVPYVNGAICPIVSSSALGDATAQQSSGSLDNSTIAIIAVGSVIGVLLVIVIIVLVVVRKKKVEEFV